MEGVCNNVPQIPILVYLKENAKYAMMDANNAQAQYTMNAFNVQKAYTYLETLIKEDASSAQQTVKYALMMQDLA